MLGLAVGCSHAVRSPMRIPELMFTYVHAEPVWPVVKLTSLDVLVGYATRSLISS